MDPAVASIVIAVIGSLATVIGVLYNDRREHRNAAAAAVDRTETEMERVLRERLILRDEQVKTLQERVDELAARIRSSGGSP